MGHFLLAVKPNWVIKRSARLAEPDGPPALATPLRAVLTFTGPTRKLDPSEADRMRGTRAKSRVSSAFINPLG